jgi:hypothetical protein
MTVVRILGLAVSAAMLVAILFGLAQGDLAAEGSQIWGMPWGRVSLVDLYLGLAIFGVWVGVREGSVAAKAAWWASLLLLGNLAAGIYLTVAGFRSRDIRTLLLGVRANV